ncbi:Signal peptidase complex catalytic subunit [Basidiobolus ranarum]|uniref:Signal peptidase complex catalytic subunit SEC11 n=1 Tax=Basidiobolus ranarum TaxID=34480 RepID=A0ABR2W1T5_9FUNG
MEALTALRRMSVRQLTIQVLNVMMVVSSALMVWKGMGIWANSESPIVVVLSGSMEPAFYRGDLLFLSMSQEPVRVGDITVFKIKGRDIPIVHRVLKVHEEKDNGNTLILTKGDNNPVDDRGLYNRGQYWIAPEDIIGRVKGHMPYLGMVTILMNDYPQAKMVLLGVMGIYILLSKE